jgi:elongator complex protein 1
VIPSNLDFRFELNEELNMGFNEKLRRLEQGSKIIMAVPSHINLVLQMPRGNLETIYPRALVLSTIRHAIEAKEYRGAFLACRKHRIDLNILIDHAFDQFCEMVDEFITQIKEPDYLNLFITGLKDEDVTLTMYPSGSFSGVLSKTKTRENKINHICNIIRIALQNLSNLDYNQPILTSDAKKVPAALEDAMLRIADIKKTQGAEAAENALKYLIFLVDVESLFHVALGIYDFPLVLMVAQHSQMDPREYLPFLGNLKKLPFNYQRFKIDDHLKKYGKALGHLSRCDDRHEEFKTYLNQHGLYKEGLEFFEIGSERHTAVVLEFARYQSVAQVFDQAGMRKIKL